MGDWALSAYASERNRLSVDEQVVDFPCFSGKWLGNKPPFLFLDHHSKGVCYHSSYGLFFFSLYVTRHKTADRDATYK